MRYTKSSRRVDLGTLLLRARGCLARSTESTARHGSSSVETEEIEKDREIGTEGCASNSSLRRGTHALSISSWNVISFSLQACVRVATTPSIFERVSISDNVDCNLLGDWATVGRRIRTLSPNWKIL